MSVCQHKNVRLLHHEKDGMGWRDAEFYFSCDNCGNCLTHQLPGTSQFGHFNKGDIPKDVCRAFIASTIKSYAYTPPPKPKRHWFPWWMRLGNLIKLAVLTAILFVWRRRAGSRTIIKQEAGQ